MSPAPVRAKLADEAIRLADLPDARQHTIAMLGREQAGIPVEALDLLDMSVGIPMIGAGASLNAAVAGSLVLYRLAGFHGLRQMRATGAGGTYRSVDSVDPHRLRLVIR